MDMMGSGGGGMSMPLTDSGVDLKNQTQAADFLGEILDDTVFQVIGNAYARYFWYGAVVVIGIAGLRNVLDLAVQKTRLRAAVSRSSRPASPKNVFTRCYATVVAIGREISYIQYTPATTGRWFKVPPLGPNLLLLIYLGFLLALEFNDNDVPGAQHYTALGVRAAWLAIAQLPLLILLAGKNNLIGLVTGVSYERLHVFHRWVARAILLLATLHFGYQSYGWNMYGLMQLEWDTDTCPPTGIAAYAVLLWINLSTLAPIRNFSYEFFVVQHIISFFCFIVAVMYHLPSTALYSRVYIWIPIGLYIFDRLVRTLRWTINNVRPGKAALLPSDTGVTKIRVTNKHIKTWRPGAHVFLSIPRFGVGQSHPATIASTPTSHGGDLIFLLKGHKGFTKRIANSPSPSTVSLLSDDGRHQERPADEYVAFIDGPYGGSHADFATFDTVVLIAGSTGITFCLPILFDLLERATAQLIPTKRIHLILIVKTSACLSWFSKELGEVLENHRESRSSPVDIDIHVYVTCDSTMAGAMDEKPQSGECSCLKCEIPCCCAHPVDLSRKQSSSGYSLDLKQPTHEYLSMPSKSSDGDSSLQRPSSGRPASVLVNPCRPQLDTMLWDLLETAEGETGIAVCGPLGLTKDVRNTVARLSDERAVHKGSGAQGIYLHAEDFGW